MRSLRPRPSSRRWRWDRLHVARFTHPLAAGKGSNAIQSLIYAIPRALFGLSPLPLPGDTTTVRVGSVPRAVLPAQEFDILYASVARLLLDVAHPDASRIITPLGQSGHPLSPHYADLAPLWADMRSTPAPLSAQGITALGNAALGRSSQ